MARPTYTATYSDGHEVTLTVSDELAGLFEAQAGGTPKWAARAVDGSTSWWAKKADAEKAAAGKATPGGAQPEVAPAKRSPST